MRWLCMALVCMAAAGCGGAIPRATDDQVVRAAQRWPGTTRASLERGRDVYVTRCSSCHNLYKPSSHRSAQWPAILSVMAPRAKLAPHEAELVLRYLWIVAAK